MPIYEYYCPQNHRIYSFLAPSIAYRKRLPKCPDNPELSLQKQVSAFAIGKGGEPENALSAEDPFAGVEESKLEQLVADMEKEMGGTNPENPDPRKLGKAMRKMTEAMGGKVSAGMEEMFSRLENGDDPTELEAEYGDALDDAEFELGAALKRATQGTLRKPSRDPILYDFRDYL